MQHRAALSSHGRGSVLAFAVVAVLSVPAVMLVIAQHVFAWHNPWTWRENNKGQ